MVIALDTIERVHSLGLGAFPRNYELWYTYFEGQNSDLNAAVDSLINANGFISHDEADAICRKYLRPQSDVDSIENVCTRLTSWLYTIVREVAEGQSTITDYSNSLESATEELAGLDDERLNGVVQKLIDATTVMQERNSHLETRLQEAHTQMADMRTTMEAVRNEVITDQLTSLSNRRYFDHVLTEAIRHSFDTGQDLSLILGDVDSFKSFNDTWGHQTGDQVLKLVSSVIRRSIKGRDVAARYGGEEFAVILPETRLRDAKTLADSIRSEIMMKKLVRKSSGATIGRVTISFGIATLRAGDTAEDIIERADKALYAAKRAGRNCVKMSTDVESAEDRSAA